MYDPKYKLPTICRRCYYRRKENSDNYYNGKSRYDSRCAYLNLTGEIRGCTPTDGECEKFKPRIRTKSLTGKHKTIN